MTATPSLSDTAYKYIQQKLLHAQLPAGAKISEHALSREIGISRTPIREAIRRLESEGVLSQVASKGTYVARHDRTELVDLYEVRMALERSAVRRAIRRIRPAEASELQRLCDQMRAAARAFRDSGLAVMDGAPLRTYLTADLAFHLLLLRIAGNRYAAKIIGDVHFRTAMFGYRSHDRNLRHVARTWLAHARAALAIRRGDRRLAQRWLLRHIRSSLRDALQSFDGRQGAVPAAAPAGFAATMEALIVRAQRWPPRARLRCAGGSPPSVHTPS